MTLDALIERTVRQEMMFEGIESLPILPEGRPTGTPTTARILEIFSDVCWYEFERGRETVTFPISLSPLQKQLPELWKLGEVRPTHRKKAQKPHTWRTRKDPFELIFPMILKWLESEPDRNAKELFLRLQRKYPREFKDCQLRTLQRRIKDWRSKMARNLLKLYTYEEMNTEEVTTTTAR